MLQARLGFDYDPFVRLIGSYFQTARVVTALLLARNVPTGIPHLLIEVLYSLLLLQFYV